MILQNNMSEQCLSEQCAHFVGKDRFHVYRHKFIWTITIASLLSVFAFVCVAFSFNRSQEEIVKANSDAIIRIESQLSQAVTESRDSCYYANEQLVASLLDYAVSIKSLLELETTRIQSDYSLLSLWAGILMIVFLVFSIYSMFKTDEVLRQSKIGLDAVDEAGRKANSMITMVDDKIKEELETVSKKAKEEIDTIKNEALKTHDEIKEDIDAKQKSFEEKYEEMMNKMQQVQEENTKIFENFLQQFKDYNSEQKDGVEQKGGKK